MVKGGGRCIGCKRAVGPDDVVVTKEGRWHVCDDCLAHARKHGWLSKKG